MRAPRVMTWAAASFSIFVLACNGLWSDFTYREGGASGGGGGGVGAGSNVGGGGGSTTVGPTGGTGASFAVGCANGEAAVDSVDVEPIPTGLSGQELDVAVHGDRVAIISDLSPITLLTLGVDGTLDGEQVESETDMGSQGETLDIVATPQWFSVSVTGVQEVGVERFTIDGERAGAIMFPGSGILRPLSTRYPGGVLLSMIGTPDLEVTLIPDVATSPPAVVAVTPAAPVCCSIRYWSVGRFASGTFGVPWRGQSEPVNYRTVDEEGQPADPAVLVPELDGLVPTASASVGEHVAFLVGTMLFVLSEDGTVQSSGMLPSVQRGYDLASTGESLRVAWTTMEGSVRFARLATDGTLSGEIEVASDAEPGRPAIAWDGTGFAVAFPKAAIVNDIIAHYAHVNVCE